MLGARLLEPQQSCDLLECGALGEANGVLPPIVEAAVLDQADRRADHRHQCLRIGVGRRSRAGAGVEQRLDVFASIAALARAGDHYRAKPAAADIGGERVELDAEAVGGLAGGQQHRYRLISRSRLTSSSCTYLVSPLSRRHPMSATANLRTARIE